MNADAAVTFAGNTASNASMDAFDYGLQGLEPTPGHPAKRSIRNARRVQPLSGRAGRDGLGQLAFPCARPIRLSSATARLPVPSWFPSRPRRRACVALLAALAVFGLRRRRGGLDRLASAGGDPRLVSPDGRRRRYRGFAIFQERAAALQGRPCCDASPGLQWLAVAITAISEPSLGEPCHETRHARPHSVALGGLGRDRLLLDHRSRPGGRSGGPATRLHRQARGRVSRTQPGVLLVPSPGGGDSRHGTRRAAADRDDVAEAPEGLGLLLGPVRDARATTWARPGPGPPRCRSWPGSASRATW